MKISVAIATYNEKENILKTVASVYAWVDEIIVIDGSSTDGTVASLKKIDNDNKININITSNPTMFHINKQKALEKCKGEWILQLDTDEVVSEELKKEIQEIVNENNSSLVAYWMPRLNHFLRRPLRKGGQYPDYTIRLYKNGTARFPCKSVHEQVVIKSKEVPQPNTVSKQELEGYETGVLKNPLLHFPWASLRDYLNKALMRYSYQEALEQQKKGFHPSPFNALSYIFILPTVWFTKTYFRHKGFMDGYQGFIYSFLSSIRYWIIFAILIKKSSPKKWRNKNR